MHCLLLILALLVASPALGEEAMRIGTTFAPPLSVPDGTGKLDLLIKEAFARTGTPLVLVTLPSERGLISAASGDTDGDINRVAGLSAKYPELVQVGESNMVYEFVAFSRRKGLAIRNWDDLRGLDMAFITGWKILEDNVKARTITKVDNAEQLFSLLSLDRVDAVLFNRRGGEYHLRQMGLTDVVTHTPPLATREMFLYLNRRHAALAPRLAQTLRDMKADGTHARIFGDAPQSP